MLSYHNDPAVKELYQRRFATHFAANRVVQREVFDSESSPGCFISCTLHSYEHSRFPVELGWPEWLAYLADSIFEALPKEDAPQFGSDLLAAVPVGVDLNPVRFVLAIHRHAAQLKRLKDNKQPYARKCEAAITLAIDYCQAQLDGTVKGGDSATAKSVAKFAAKAARSAGLAAKAARYAAESAYWSSTESENSAAGSAAWEVKSARATAESDELAESVATAVWQQERDLLLKTLRSL